MSGDSDLVGYAKGISIGGAGPRAGHRIPDDVWKRIFSNVVPHDSSSKVKASPDIPKKKPKPSIPKPKPSIPNRTPEIPNRNSKPQKRPSNSARKTIKRQQIHQSLPQHITAAMIRNFERNGECYCVCGKTRRVHQNGEKCYLI